MNGDAFEVREVARVDGVPGAEEIYPHRKIGAVVSLYVAQLRERCEESILRVAPEYKQRSAALGLEEPTEAGAIRLAITSRRSVFRDARAQLEALVADGILADEHAARCSVADSIFAQACEELAAQ